MKIIFCLSFTLATFVSNGQKYFEVDLSKRSLLEPTIDLNYTGIKIVNKLRLKDYKIKVRVEQEKPGSQDASLASLTSDDCFKKYTAFSTAFDNLKNEVKDEVNMPGLKTKLKTELEKINDNECKPLLTTAYENLLAETEEIVGFTFDLEKNQNIFVTISRLDDNGEEEKVWEIVLRTPRSVSFLSHFGFTFSPNLIKEPDTYYSKEISQDNYTITKLQNNGSEFWKDLSLTANFLLPINRAKNKGKGEVTPAWMAGFGIGGDARFTVFTGPALLHSDFLSLGLGFGVNYSHKLKGTYSPNESIKENLNFDQLHERGIRPTILLSLSFRLSKKQLQGGEIENIGK
jgi:hypothetical protein